MAMTNPNLMCVFDEPAQADDAINALENAGFGADQIYYSSRPNNDNGFFASLRNLFSANNGDSNVSHDLKDLGLTSDEADYYQQQHRAGHGIVAVQANGRDQEALSILRSLGAHVYGTQNTSDQSGTYGTTDTERADGDYGATGGNRTDTYQNDQTYNNAGAGMGATPDQQDYSNAGTGAGAYQNDPAYGNTGIGAGSDRGQAPYGGAGTGAGMYQNDPADANNMASGAGTYQQQNNDPAYNNAGTYQRQNNDPAYNNAGTYQQQNNDPAYNNAGTYQQQQNDPAYNNAGTYQQQQQQNDPAYNNAGTGAGTYQQNERDANTYADNRVGNEVAREQRRMGTRGTENDVSMDERARENYDPNRDPNNNL
ncbi:hypothetical protein KDH_75710 [Dictyobacter sp. S3.2.2.5]|uniref:General stress protein 17M-like domain-containing protein n=1 Tax=Dictyobacter halimunensis TaxID=3026934 RepID=A0ABQ6G7Y3_9CHLR|nr:hypothetical protein KDH_75710 [Dictyobacter sp. S3.2.2.5]